MKEQDARDKMAEFQKKQIEKAMQRDFMNHNNSVLAVIYPYIFQNQHNLMKRKRLEKINQKSMDRKYFA